MGKKIKKKAKKKPTPLQSAKRAPDAQPLKRVACVECPQFKRLTPMSTCVKCEYHDKGMCTFKAEPFRIKVVSINEPMKFNRLNTQISTESVQDDARNYYFLTQIMQPVKRITKEPYKTLKNMLLTGKLSEPDNNHIHWFDKLDGVVFLERTEERDKVCFFNGGKMYRETDEYDTSGVWVGMYYLYAVYSYTGLGDVSIDGESYKLLSKPLTDLPPNLVMCGKDDKIVIGLTKNECSAPT